MFSAVKNTFNEDLVNKILNSKTPVTVSTTKSQEKTSISNLIQDAKDKNKNIIFTITPGPFKSAPELPEDWMKTDPAKGCTPQLNALNEYAKNSDLIVYAINKQTSNYQCGADGLCAVKKWEHLFMISDDDGVLAKEWKLPTFEVNKKNYLERISIVINKNGEGKLFFLNSPVDDVKAKDHVEKISNFISKPAYTP